jgi:general secretion pathway protein D
VVVANQASNTVSVILDKANVSVSPNAPLTSYPASEYVDLGLKVHAVPRIHPDDDVTLDLQFEISSLSGQNVNGIPILSNRTVEHTVRLREGQTNVISGILQSSDLQSANGWPGLGELPAIGQVTSDRGKQIADTELLIAITPRELRLADNTDRTIYAGRGAGSNAPAAPGPAAPGTVSAPNPPPGPGQPPQPGQPGQPPTAAPVAPGPAGAQPQGPPPQATPPTQPEPQPNATPAQPQQQQ